MIEFFQTRSRTMVDSKDVISVKIEKINDTQIRCTLTSEDLADRQLKLSELAYGSEKAKDLFRDMMLQAQDQFGFEADNVPLMIEAIPITPDSIVLIITKVEDPEELIPVFPSLLPVPMKLLLPRRKGRLLPVQTTSWIFSRNCVKDDSKSLLLPLKKIKPKIPPTEKQRFSRILQKHTLIQRQRKMTLLRPVRI